MTVVSNLQGALRSLAVLGDGGATVDFATACMDVHRSVQRTFDTLWNEHDVVVSLKIVDSEKPDHLKCIYLPEGLSNRRMSLLGNGAPEYIPIAGSVSGDAFLKKEPQFVGNVSVEMDRLAGELQDYVSKNISCIVAWPLFMNRQPIGVLKVDSPTVNLFTVDDGLFVKIMQLASTQFELAATLFSHLRPDLASDPAEKKTPSKSKRAAKSATKR